MWEEVEALKLAEKVVGKEAAAAKAKLVAHLGCAEGWKLPDGRVFEYREEGGSARIAPGKLKERHPRIFKQLSTPGSRRVIREVKTK